MAPREPPFADSRPSETPWMEKDSEMRAEPPLSDGAAETSTTGTGLPLREAVAVNEPDDDGESDGADERVALAVPVAVRDCRGMRKVRVRNRDHILKRAAFVQLPIQEFAAWKNEAPRESGTTRAAVLGSHCPHRGQGPPFAACRQLTAVVDTDADSEPEAAGVPVLLRAELEDGV
jgi:hypothetical protein